MKIAYFIHGRGRGHSSRALPLLSRFRENDWDSRVFAGKDAVHVLNGYEDFQPIDSIVPGSSFYAFIKRIIQDYRLLKKYNPDFLISDGDAPSMYAATILGIHVVSIGHSLIFPFCKHPFGLNPLGLFKENLKVRAASQLADYRLAVHFFPIESKNGKTFVVMPASILTHANFEPESYVVSYFRDENGKRILSALTKKGVKVKNFGHPVTIDGVDNFPFGNGSFKEALLKSGGVVGSAGSNLIFEAIVLRKPLLLVYSKGDFEQESNIKYVEYAEMGLGMKNDEIIEKKIDSFIFLLENKEKPCDIPGVMPVLTDVLVEYLATKAPIVLSAKIF